MADYHVLRDGVYGVGAAGGMMEDSAGMVSASSYGHPAASASAPGPGMMPQGIPGAPSQNSSAVMQGMVSHQQAQPVQPGPPMASGPMNAYHQGAVHTYPQSEVPQNLHRYPGYGSQLQTSNMSGLCPDTIVIFGVNVSGRKGPRDCKQLSTNRREMVLANIGTSKTSCTVYKILTAVDCAVATACHRMSRSTRADVCLDAPVSLEQITFPSSFHLLHVLCTVDACRFISAAIRGNDQPAVRRPNTKSIVRSPDCLN